MFVPFPDCIDIGFSYTHGQLSSFVHAGFRAVTTLTFVAPALILPRVMDQLRRDLDPAELESIGLHEYSIWKTPEGTLFVDGELFTLTKGLRLTTDEVLVRKKDTPVEKGKDSEIRKWEAELRKNLATKKPANASGLSKQDKALVDAQLVKESQVRAKVTAVKAKLDRGLHLVRSIMAASPEELHPLISSITSLLIAGVVRRGPIFVGSAAFETYVVSQSFLMHFILKIHILNRRLVTLVRSVWGASVAGSASVPCGVSTSGVYLKKSR
jgi:hypothetical protein